MDAIYEELERQQTIIKEKVDLLIICGDFQVCIIITYLTWLYSFNQAIRNYVDLESLSCPERFKRLGDFHQYYSGFKKAPVLTLFIGGNHEASNYLRELYYGGWICPNIYYIGHAGLVRFGGLRIAGLSGIFKGFDYKKGRYETPPYSPNDLKTAYHVRKYDVDRLLMVCTK